MSNGLLPNIDTGIFRQNMPHFDVPSFELPRNTDHQLLILGNGFDLKCGLRSSFGDFFASRVLELEDIKALEGKDFAESVQDKGLTAWDMVLSSRRSMPGDYMEANWCNVEAAIASVVTNNERIEEFWPDDGKPITAYSITEAIGSLLATESDEDGTMPSDTEIEAEPIECEPSLMEPGWGRDLGEGICRGVWRSECDENNVLVARYLIVAYPNNEWGEQTVLAALLDELHKLERQFADYLGKVVAENERYVEKSYYFLTKLVEHGVDGDNDHTVTILDFNYTTPLIPNSSGVIVSDFLNIHGRLGSEIVFGIDGTGKMDDRDVIRFTKTYRLLGLRSVESHPPVAYAKSLGMGRTETVAIKFYGHSLAEADYSYFQSIFDMANLYDSDVKLCFFYSNYREGAEEDMFMRVTGLLSVYGETMENKEHGKNLVHKLLLEGRLSVVEF